jgi:Protein of unknown function (DUF2939)
MKKLIGLVLLGLIGFYGLWPAYSGYQINNALQMKDAALLARKIDFDAVRVSLKPAVAEEVAKQLDSAGKDSGLGGLLGGELKKQLLPQIVETAVATIVTPANVIRIYSEGGDLKSTVEKIMREKMAQGGLGQLGGAAGGGGAVPALPGGITLPGGLGGLGDLMGKAGIDPSKVGGAIGSTAPKPATPTPAATTTAKATPAFGLSNVKHLALAGPLGFEVGVAKDAAATKSDVIAGMSFTGFDWKLTKIVPN